MGAGAPHLARLPSTEWEWLALAQLFAVSGKSDADSAVWCFRYRRSRKTEAVDPYSIDEVYVVRPAHISAHVTGQVNYATLFPGLDGIARHITWSNTVLEDETPNRKRTELRGHEEGRRQL